MVYNGSTSFFTNIVFVFGTALYSSVVTNLVQDETYTFYMYSKGLSNNSVQSNKVTVTTLPHTLPLAPTNLAVTYCYKQATLSWANADPTVTGYDVYLNSGLKASNVSSPYIYTGLFNGFTYSLGVLAKNSFGSSPTSSVNAILPIVQTYFGVSGPAGQVTQTVTPSDYIITFTAGPSTVVYAYSSACASVNANCTLTLVGGGGGGASGNLLAGGGGGAGGQVLIDQPIVFAPGNTLSVTNVGGGGTGGTYGFDGLLGGTSTVTLNSSSYTALGGGGGVSSSTSPGGAGLGGNGGSGATASGNDGISGNNCAVNGYSGGGGGGAYPSTILTGSGGVGGLDGIGGAGGFAVNISFSPNGFSAITTGGGGGGGCGGTNINPDIVGGNGFRGIVIFTIPV